MISGPKVKCHSTQDIDILYFLENIHFAGSLGSSCRSWSFNFFTWGPYKFIVIPYTQSCWGSIFYLSIRQSVFWSCTLKVAHYSEAYTFYDTSQDDSLNVKWNWLYICLLLLLFVIVIFSSIWFNVLLTQWIKFWVCESQITSTKGFCSHWLKF